MKSLSTELLAHYAAGGTTLARLWKLTRQDAEVFAFTDHDSAITYLSITYEPSSVFDASAISTSGDLNVDNLDTQGLLDSAGITSQDLEAGLWDGAEVEIVEVNYKDLTMGHNPLRFGSLGEVQRSGLTYTAELRGLMHKLQNNIGRTVTPSCDAVLGDARCGVDLEAGPGVWFRVEGTGHSVKVVKDDEQAFTHQISVYQGHCGELECVTGDNLKGSALWNTKKGESYLVRVNGVNGAAGNFKILLEDLMEGTDNVAANDLCEDSMGLATDGSFVYATTETATFDMDGAGTCYHAANAGPGVWYDVTGIQGGSLLATTNTSDVMLAVFKGECGNLECVGASDMATGVPSSVQWETEGAERYKILAHGAGGKKGIPFDVSVTTSTNDAHFVINDFCKGAVGPIASDGSFLQGSTEHATLDRDGAGSCYPETLAGNGVWYSVSGTGDILKVFPTGGSDIEPLVSVFQGSCRKLQCVEGSRHEIDEEERSVLSWKSDVDQTYYLLVRGTDNARGKFQIVVDSEKAPTESDEAPTEEPTEAPEASETEAAVVAERPVNDYCDAATLIPSIEYLIQDTTVNATTYLDGIGRCHSQKSVGPGMWYRISGTGKQAKASITGNSTLDAFISVYSGDCEDLFCIADVSGDTGSKRSFTWDTNEGEAYYILVQGKFGQKGEFELRVHEPAPVVEAAVNDFCLGALGPIPSNGTVVKGSNEHATIDTDGAGSCYDNNMTGVGVWYTVVGTGSQLELFSKGEADFTVSVAVFDGFDCGSLQCIAADHANEYKAGILSWESIKNVPYYVLVSGVGNAVGCFEFGVVPGKKVPEETGQEVAINIISQNDKCPDATGLSLSENIVLTGTTAEASVIQEVKAGSCSNSAGGSLGLWYTVVGSGSKLHASARSLSSGTSTGISVFAGSCDDLSCVDGTADKNTGSIYWDSKNDTIYQLYIHSPRNATGSFELKLEAAKDSEAPMNDFCEANLPPLVTDGTAVQGSNIGATTDVALGNCYGQTDVGPGVWFRVNGNGNVMTLAQNTALPMDTVISLFQGSCDSLVCLNGIGRPIQQSGPRLSWGTIAGQDYYILVQSSTAETGIFEFGIEEYVKGGPTETGSPALTDPPAQTESPVLVTGNDNCQDAVGPLPVSSVHVGTFAEATEDGVGVCGTAENEERGVWFTVQGTGKGIRISTCQPDSGSGAGLTSVSVFRDGCDNLQCLAGNNNTCADDGTITWNTEKDELYHVLVTGEGSEDDYYTLLHNQTEWLPSNCMDASKDFEKQLHTLHDMFTSSGNTELSGPLAANNWLSGCDVCNKWGGLQCNEEAAVTRIHLGMFMLKRCALVCLSCLLCYISNLHTLSRLSLNTAAQNPPLTGNLPDSIRDLKELGTEVFSCNRSHFRRISRLIC